jgi:hypothetical protein
MLGAKRGFRKPVRIAGMLAALSEVLQAPTPLVVRNFHEGYRISVHATGVVIEVTDYPCQVAVPGREGAGGAVPRPSGARRPFMMGMLLRLTHGPEFDDRAMHLRDLRPGSSYFAGQPVRSQPLRIGDGGRCRSWFRLVEPHERQASRAIR